MKNVSGLEYILFQVYRALQVLHYHYSRVQAVMGACVCGKNEPDYGMSRNPRLHLCCRANDSTCAFGKLHVVGGVIILANLLPRGVSDAW